MPLHIFFCYVAFVICLLIVHISLLAIVLPYVLLLRRTETEENIFSDFGVSHRLVLSLMNLWKLHQTIQIFRIFLLGRRTSGVTTTNYELSINTQTSADELWWKNLKLALSWQLLFVPTVNPILHVVVGSCFTMTVMYLLTFTVGWSFACVNQATL